MNVISTKYGDLKGVVSAEFYPNGTLKECILDEYNEIYTNYGRLVPSYENGEVRKKYTKSVSFYETGEIKSIALQKQKPINTRIGIIPAELITFYKSGNIKRIFPLNGNISGYWTEDDEYNLAEEFKLNFEFGIFKTKFISIHLYDSQEMKSITLWPKERVNLSLPIGNIEIRKGISFFYDGKIKTVEPSKPALINTPIGNINAYDTTALGINGDNNSLCFSEDGNIKSLLSATDEIEVVSKNGNKVIVKQTLKQNLFNNDMMDVIPLKIEFFDNKVRFNGDIKNEYDIEENTFTIKHKVLNAENKCGNCEGCSACG